MIRKLLSTSNSKKMIIVLLISVIAIIGIYFFYLSNLSYAVILDGKEIGITKNKDEIPKIMESINKELNDKRGQQIESSPMITYEEIWGTDQTTDSVESMTMMAEKSLGLKVEAYALNVDGEDLFFLYNKESVDIIIEKLKEKNTERLDDNNIKEIRILEDVNVIPQTTNVENVIDEDEALDIIVTGTEAIQKYSIQQGDTASQIAVNFDIKLKDIENANPDVNMNRLQIGQILNLTVPKPLINVEVIQETEYIEAIPFDIKYEESSKMYKGETKTSFKGREGKKEIKEEVTYINGIIKDKTIIEENIIEEPSSKVILKGITPRPKTLAYGKFNNPTRGNGRISSRFGPRWGSYHKGLDIANPTGTPIVAADGGKVVFSGWQGDYGYLVIINHENGYQTYYAHCSKILVKKGERVYRGQTIAKVGNTGRSTGPHVHFEVRKNGVPKDPLKYINF